ncbi:MAG: hypothetical protein BWY24_00638 [Microgenomates group bacterium ADurb.Bin219]|nr:MAG: hypothetical protein BWY24_00638 [Microgenomates group bacterium ADurb.Bin219]HNP89171.1 hypothetical protein [Candidatus Woesebacteria bacterium]
MKSQKLKVKTFAFCVLSFVFCAFNFVAKAANAQTYSVSLWPPLLELIIKPGKSATQVYKISNMGDPQILITKVLPFEPADNQGNVNILNLPTLLSPLNFSFQGGDLPLGKAFALKSGENRDLVLKISVPKNTPEKDFYASFVLETSPEGKIGQSITQTAAKIAGNILISVSNSLFPAKKGKILEFSSPKIVDSFDAVPFVLKVENLGDSFFKTFGEIKIEGIFNQSGTVKILPENILAKTFRDLSLVPWKEKFIVGPFRATAEFTLDEKSQENPTPAKLTAQTNFLALPYKAMFALLIIILILITIKNLPTRINPPSHRTN